MNQRVPPNPSTGRHVESMGARYHRAGLNSVRSSAFEKADRGVKMGSMGAWYHRAGLNSVTSVASPRSELG